MGTFKSSVVGAFDSDPMMIPSTHSLVLVQCKDGADIEAIKKEIQENINPRKWICVEAEVVYIVNSGNTVMAIMTYSDTAEPIYNAFVEIYGNVGARLDVATGA